jgi:hypothetical protein
MMWDFGRAIETEEERKPRGEREQRKGKREKRKG